MKLSVIIPAWGDTPHLDRAVRSVERSGFSDLEIVMCAPQAGGGAGSARNVGIEKASGRYLHFLDADDEVLPGAYGEFVNFADVHQLDIVRGNGIAFDDITGARLPNFGLYGHRWVAGPICKRAISASDSPVAMMRLSMVPWAGIIRRDFVERNDLRFSDSTCGNDVVFFVQSLLSAKRIQLLKRPLVLHRVNNAKSLVGCRHFHYQCDFENCSAVMAMVKDIDDALRLSITDAMLNGIAAWLSKYDTSNVLTPSIRKYAISYLNGLDFSAWKHIERRSWFNNLRRVLGSEVFPRVRNSRMMLFWKIMNRVREELNMRLG